MQTDGSPALQTRTNGANETPIFSSRSTILSAFQEHKRLYTHMPASTVPINVKYVPTQLIFLCIQPLLFLEDRQFDTLALWQGNKWFATLPNDEHIANTSGKVIFS